jgi:hypothetical protein
MISCQASLAKANRQYLHVNPQVNVDFVVQGSRKCFFTLDEVNGQVNLAMIKAKLTLKERQVFQFLGSSMMEAVRMRSGCLISWLLHDGGNKNAIWVSYFLGSSMMEAMSMRSGNSCFRRFISRSIVVKGRSLISSKFSHPKTLPAVSRSFAYRGVTFTTCEQEIGLGKS